MASTKFTNHKDTYQTALRSLFKGQPEHAESDLSQLFSPNFTFEANNQEKYDFPGFVTHIRRLREMKLEGNLTIVQFLRDGAQLAERHSSWITMPDGTVSHAETLQFAEVTGDGRIAWIVEVVQRKPSTDTEPMGKLHWGDEEDDKANRC